MSRVWKLLLVLIILALVAPQIGLAQTSSPAPNVPGTGPFSVQMFAGGTEYTYLTVYPPTTYADGTAIPADTAVQIKVYRWNRAGRVWSPVALEGGSGPWGSGGQGTAGQAFINMVAVTPVDCIPPRVIVLGVTAVVGGVESPIINTDNLTFRYAAPPPPDDSSPYDATPCVPLLVRFTRPTDALTPDQAPPQNSPPPGAAPALPPPTPTPLPPPLDPTPTPPPSVAPSGPPHIDAVRPVVGAVASAEQAMPGALRNMQIAILGTNFDPIDPAKNVVTFNGVEAAVLGVTSVEIRAEVPPGATSGPVKVTVGDLESNAVDLVVTTNYANAVVAEDVRYGREWLPDLFQAILGAPDHDGPAGVGTPGTNIGIGNGGSIVVDLGEGQEVYDAPGYDLVVYERGGGEDESLANEAYEVLVSNSLDSGFVSLGTAYGVDRGIGDKFDLAVGGVASARYVKIVDDGDDTTPNGADIDAVEVVSVTAAAEGPAPAEALDLVFVIDLTDSMADDIASVKEQAVEILNILTTQFSDFRVAIVGYRDWGDEPMFEDYPFSSDKDAIIANINSLTVFGGGDWPEAVLEALFRTIESSTIGGWRNDVRKQIVLMGDAPPHDPVPQGPQAGQTQADVQVAAKRADPVVINTILVGSDETTKEAFGNLASGSGGAATQAERAEDVPRAIMGTISEIAGAPAAVTTEVVTAEVESNDSFGRANPIMASGVVTGAIDPQRDGDWYEIVVDRGGELSVLITEVAPELDIVFRVWDANRDVYADWQAPLEKGGDVEANIDLREAGKYVLEVRDSRDDAASAQQYRLQTAFTPMVDMGEANDSMGTATALDLGVAIQANILPVRDHDWYRIEIPGRSELHVLVSNVAENLDIVFRVWNANREVIRDWQSPLRAGADTEAFVDFGSPGTYYLEVADSRDDQRSAQPYTLETSLLPVVDAEERNDSFGDAEPIMLGQPYQGAILPVRDHDWYRIETPGRAELYVLITNVAPELEIVFRVWNANRDVLLDWQAPLRAGGDTQAVVDLPQGGNYYLEIADSRDDQRSAQPYVLETKLTSVVDAGERNDSFGKAEPIQLGQVVQGSILPMRDHDWYSILVPAQGELEVSITNSPANLEMVFRVWNADRDVILDWQAPLRAGGDTVGLAAIPEAGTYYIEVADSRDDGRAVEPYTLIAVLTGS